MTNRYSGRRPSSLDCTKHHQVSEVAAERKPDVCNKMDKERAYGDINMIPRKVREC